MAGRLPTIMLPYSSPPSDTMLDMSGTLPVVRIIAPLPPVADEAPLSVPAFPQNETRENGRNYVFVDHFRCINRKEGSTGPAVMYEVTYRQLVDTVRLCDCNLFWQNVSKSKTEPPHRVSQ